MSDKIFLDTNILIYTFDSSAPQKQQVALALLNSGLAQDQAVLSVQVLSEFFNAATKRLPTPLTSEEAREFIDLIDILQVVDIDTKLVKRAIDTHLKYQISYWDGLIIAAAERGQCGTILSEDLNAGQLYNNIRVENPFDGL